MIALLPQAAHAATAPQTADRLNAQRAANGLPAGITVDQAWSSKCAAHDQYMALNHQLTHDEVPGKAGYTPGGAEAGQNAVLSEGDNWDTGNPYETAPIHLEQLLAPRLQFIGTADADGFSCTTTFPGWTRPDPAALTVYTYPGDGAHIYASETAAEDPQTPGELKGIPRGATTGPYLYVLVDAPGQSPVANPAALTGVTLTGPSGAVAVKTVDGTTPVPGGGTLGDYLSPGGFIIPVAPLVIGATYHAHVNVIFAGVTTSHDWSFTTVPGSGGQDPHSALSARGASLALSSQSPAPVVVGFTSGHGDHAPSVTIAPGHNATLHLPPGHWQACGHQPAASGFSSYDSCIPLTVTGVPGLRFASETVKGQRLVVSLSYGSILKGRQATLKVTELTVHCVRNHCTKHAGRTSKRTIKLGTVSLSFPLPAHQHGLRLTLDTRAFSIGDAPWAAAHAAVTITRP
jgi:hypothetical protein